MIWDKMFVLVFLTLFVVTGSVTACREKRPSAVFSSEEGSVKVELETANTPMERRRGLMYRDRLGDRNGMLFCYEDDRKRAFWMKNTYISLDIIFLSASGAIVEILEKLPPCPMDPCPTYRSRMPARFAMEVNAGFAARHGLQAGDTVKLDLIDR